MATTAAPKPSDEAPAPDPAAVPVAGDLEKAEEAVERKWVAIKNFRAHHKTQLLRFEKDDELVGELGADLASKGAPVRAVE